MPALTENSIDVLVQRSRDVLLPNYARRPIAFTRGDGATLWDTAGNSYIDFCAGIATCSLGHGDTAVARAIADQALRLMHVSNLYEIPEQIELAEKLKSFIGFDRFFFCNSGAEANEALIKLVRGWGNPQGKQEIIIARNGFHGRTLGALSATGQPALQEAFGPMLDGFTMVDYGEIESICQQISQQTAAVYLEPVQAEGGGILPPEHYLTAVRDLCDKNGAMMVLDEVQMGIGRTGYPLAQDRYAVKADAVALAKGLGGGFPIGALAVRESFSDVLGSGSHGSTFGGNPLACKAASAVIDTLMADQVLETIRNHGDHMLDFLKSLDHPQVTDPRGAGLFVCFSTLDSKSVVDAAQKQGLLVVAAKNNTIRLLPPLTIKTSELQLGLERLQAALKTLDS